MNILTLIIHFDIDFILECMYNINIMNGGIFFNSNLIDFGVNLLS